MCIAWTALFYAIFFKSGVKPFYRKKTNRRHFETVDGDKKAWEPLDLRRSILGHENLT